jgi:histone-lysine N-methyltransferase SETD2
VITDKEKKSASYSEGRLESLSDEKVTKIKKFAKDYIAKVLRKLEKAGQRRRPLSTAMTQATASSSLDTPNSHDGASADAIPGGEGEVEEEEEEEAMDIDSGSDSEADGERGNEVEDDQGDGESRSLPPDAVSASPSDRPESLAVSEPLKALSVSPFIIRPTDPRRRPPSDDQESRWDPDEDNGRGDLRELNGLPAGL